MPLALRPLASDSSMNSRNGSHRLARGLLAGAGRSGATSLAGFAAQPVSGSAPVGSIRAVESGATSLAGFAIPSESGDTSLAGFAGERQPQLPGGLTGTPAAFKYVPAVSRRTPVSF